MEGTLRVTPEQLINTSSEFSSIGSTVASLTEEMTTTVTGLASTWQGEAASAYINKFTGLNDDIQRMIAMIREHATDLQEMAQAYMASESENAQLAETLSADVIV